MRTQFLPSAAKITPDRIAFPSGHARVRGEKPTEKRAIRRETSGNQAREYAHTRWARSFSVCTLGGGFLLSLRAAVFTCAICKEIRERRQIEWSLHTAQARKKFLPPSAWTFLIVRRAGGDLSPFRDKCCGRNQHVENLPPYADWVVIDPVGLSKASVTRASRYLSVFRRFLGALQRSQISVSAGV